jgi:hypothetical protein
MRLIENKSPCPDVLKIDPTPLKTKSIPMNQIYKTGLSFLLIWAILMPGESRAQCACAGGDPIDSVVHSVTITGLADPNSVIPVPRFDPTVGILSCVRARATIFTTLEMDLYNREPFMVPDYFMNYYRITSFNGPSGGGISASQTWNKDYGPYALEGNPGLSPDSTVHIGPEVVFNSISLVRTTTNVVPYQGVGTVNFTYINTGSATMLQGSNNFRLDVKALTDVTLRVSYYFCPLAVLPSGMKNFSVVRNDDQISLSWVTENEKPGTRYVLEYSKDGRTFNAMANKTSAQTGRASYAHQFQPGAGETGKLYFRVRQTDAQGKEYFTPIKVISFDNNGEIQQTIYPNPAKKFIRVQFQSPQTGTLEIDLVNTLGQVLEHQKQRVTRSVTTQVDFARNHGKGIYWLRIRNLETGEQSVSRLTIE